MRIILPLPPFFRNVMATVEAEIEKTPTMLPIVRWCVRDTLSRYIVELLEEVCDSSNVEARLYDEERLLSSISESFSATLSIVSSLEDLQDIFDNIEWGTSEDDEGNEVPGGSKFERLLASVLTNEKETVEYYADALAFAIAPIIASVVKNDLSDALVECELLRTYCAALDGNVYIEMEDVNFDSETATVEAD